MNENPLNRQFYNRPALTVARELIGKKLVRSLDGIILTGMISETEAYTGPEDTACHASKGRTRRNEVMFGPPGHAYVYLVYGMHHMLNFVTEGPGFPAAVLIRGMVPLEGVETMARLRGKSLNLADGPGKLCSALAIDRSFNDADLAKGGILWVEEYRSVPDNDIIRTPRIGINYADPKDRDAPYRFIVRDGG